MAQEDNQVVSPPLGLWETVAHRSQAAAHIEDQPYLLAQPHLDTSSLAAIGAPEGAMVLVACVLIVQMVLWMRRHGRTLKRDMETSLQKSTQDGHWWGIAVLVALRAFNSSTWPSKTGVVITAAASK